MQLAEVIFWIENKSIKKMGCTDPVARIELRVNMRTDCVISGFQCAVDENCAVLDYYASSCGSFLLTFRDNLSVQSSGFKSKEDSWDR